MTLYAAYGVNLDPALMSERCPHSPLRTTGWLGGWRLTFGGEDNVLGDGPTATIVQDPFEQVFVAVYDVVDQDMEALEKWELADIGLYFKTKVRISALAEDLLCETYVLDTYEGGIPDARHLGALADAAEAAGAPADYVHALRTRPCRSND
ncbi:gamma-glutamylcyclotransferase family protein [Nocardioides sp. NPDC127514]|uniref:gamma-glutamylcyclotransferase family protein n=1 Tax=unclassified Nocardioides TaxID=2615069 RepID=UPI00135972CB